MSMEVQRYVGLDQRFDPMWIETIILELGDKFDIRIRWDCETAILTGVCVVAGGVIGGYAGGRLGATVGAGLGAATGLGVSKMVSLRELWVIIKDKLKELLYIVFNYLRRLDPEDYNIAFEVLWACRNKRKELVLTIIEFIVFKLGREVTSRIAIAS